MKKMMFLTILLPFYCFGMKSIAKHVGDTTMKVVISVAIEHCFGYCSSLMEQNSLYSTDAFKNNYIRSSQTGDYLGAIQTNRGDVVVHNGQAWERLAGENVLSQITMSQAAQQIGQEHAAIIAQLDADLQQLQPQGAQFLDLPNLSKEAFANLFDTFKEWATVQNYIRQRDLGGCYSPDMEKVAEKYSQQAV